MTSNGKGAEAGSHLCVQAILSGQFMTPRGTRWLRYQLRMLQG